ncbi:MAG: DnaJ domain-containing protein [Candidatus Babeliales bacterium]
MEIKRMVVMLGLMLNIIGLLAQPTYYEILGVSKTASESDLKKGYRKKALVLHPDKIQERTGMPATSEQTKKFQELVEAYDVLKDPLKKREYDIKLAQAAKASSTPKPQSAQQQYKPASKPQQATGPKPAQSQYKPTPKPQTTQPQYKPAPKPQPTQQQFKPIPTQAQKPQVPAAKPAPAAAKSAFKPAAAKKEYDFSWLESEDESDDSLSAGNSSDESDYSDDEDY